MLVGNALQACPLVTRVPFFSGVAGTAESRARLYNSYLWLGCS